MEELKFSLKRKEVKVLLEDTDGKEGTFFLREMLGKDRDQYLNGMSGRMKFEGGKPMGFKTYDGIQSSLLALTLFTENGDAVTKKEIDLFPASVAQALYEQSQKINALGDEEPEVAKND